MSKNQGSKYRGWGCIKISSLSREPEPEGPLEEQGTQRPQSMSPGSNRSMSDRVSSSPSRASQRSDGGPKLPSDFDMQPSSHQLDMWLRHVGLEEHIQLLHAERVDMESMKLLTNEDLRCS